MKTNDFAEIEIKKNSKNDLLLIFHLSLAVLCVLWLATPVVNAIPFFRAEMFLFLYIIWIVIAAYIIKGFYGVLIYKSVSFWIWLIFLALWLISGNSSQLIEKIIQFIYIYIIYSIYLFYKLKANRTLNKILVWVILLSFTLTALITIKGISENPMISKLISTADYEVGSTGIGGFSYVYAIVGIIPVLLMSLKYVNKKTKIFLIFIITILAYTVFITSFTTAIILMLGITAIIIIPGKKKTLGIIICLSLLLILLFKEDFGFFLVSFSQSINHEMMSGRIGDIGLFLVGDYLDNNSSFGNRYDNFVLSFTTFINNPFIGIGAYFGLNHLEYGVGAHSQWIDDLARFGIIGVVPLWLFLLRFYKDLLRTYKDNMYSKVIYVYFVYILFLGILNPIFKNEIMIVLFILIPFLPYLRKDDRK